MCGEDMKVTFKLYASLGQYLPNGAKRNEISVDVDEGTTIEMLLSRYNVPRESCHLVLLNGVFQPPSKWGKAELGNGDALAVWPPIAGG